MANPPLTSARISPAKRRILLGPQRLIRCYEQVKLLLSSIKQFSIGKSRPAHLCRSCNLVFAEMIPQGNWRSVIEQDAH
jgi:hypothetical protein